MAERNAKVMSMVEREIKKNSDISTEKLQEKAAKIDKKMGDLTLRQFNARYPLQVKRKMAPARKKRRRSRRSVSDGVDRSAVRSILLEFAQAIARTEDKGDLIDLINNVDGYVDKIEKAVK